MIDIRQLRENPARFALGAKAKNIPVDIDRLIALDAQKRQLLTEQERLRAEQNRLAKEIGPQIGKLKGQLKGKHGPEAADLEGQIEQLSAKPTALKAAVAEIESKINEIDPELNGILLQVPLPPDADVPVGSSADDNVEVKRWDPPAFDTRKSFEANRGFKPKTHLELVRDLGLADFERGVKIAGARSYILTGDGMRLHQAVLRFAVDFMTQENGFKAMSVPVVVREEAMVGTGFFPAGREQAYHIEESKRGGGYDLFLTGTGEVGLMGIHQGEILDEAMLPLRYITVSTCFRREAGAAGKDTAGLYRIHQFDKVEQVVICKADEAESRAWHARMIGFVETLLQRLGIPYRLLQCCTADLGPKNASMIDIESWMPGRGELGPDKSPTGAYGETHSASRLYDFQCRRLNMRYRAGGEGGKGETTFCHSLNNTVLASPRFLIPFLEIHQNADGTVTIPECLRPYMGGQARIG
ncbi:MAG TPA: serine--tRNA ligase [Phycisphaerales bacterium]|nr:serine--tRNA ligase [Phycisphaerales bacterium]